MNKKFFIFILLIAACLMSSSAVVLAGEWTYKTPEGTPEDGGTYTITYTLDGIDNATVDEVEISEIAAGSNFQARYTLPQLVFNADFKYAVDPVEIESYFELSQDKIAYEWKVIGPTVDGQALKNSNLAYSLDKDNNILIISGVLPELYGKTISYDVIATIKSINTEGLVVYEESTQSNTTFLKAIAAHAVGTSFDSEITIDIPEKSEDEPTYTYIKKGNTSFDSFVEPASEINLNSVSGDYYVTIKVPHTSTLLGNHYYNFIANGDEENYPYVELPAWLKVENITTDHQYGDNDTLYITSFVIKANTDATVITGEKARIRVKLMDENADESINTFVEWDVTCNMASSLSPSTPDDDPSGETNPFEISGSKEVKFSLSQLGATDSKTLTYTGDYVKYEATNDILKALIAKNFFKVDVDKSSKKITLTATAPSNISYPGTLRFYGKNNHVDVSVDIEVSDKSTTLDLSATSQNLELESGGSSKTVTITAAGTGLAAGAGLITWTVKKNDANLNIEPSAAVSGSTASYASRQYTISAPAGMSAGNYIITIGAEYGLVSKDIDINVKVKNNGGSTQPDDPQPADFNLTAAPTAVNAVQDGDAQTVNITVTGSPNGSLAWTHDANVSGLTIAINGNKSGATVSITAGGSAEEGTYTVTITATDADGTAKPVSFKVIVSASELTDEQKYALLIEANAEKISGHFASAEDLNVSVLESTVLLETTASVSDLVDSFAELIPAEVPVIALDGIDGSQIPEKQIYVFPVSYDLIQNAVDNEKLTVGETLLIHVFADPQEGSEYSKEYDAYFVDDSGEIITTVPPDGSDGINIAVILENLGESNNYWPVISKYKLTAITTSKKSLSLEAGRRANLKFIANKNVTSWEVSADEDIFSTRISKAKEADVANLSISASSEAEEGDYDVTVIAYDIDGTSADLTVAVTVTPMGNYSLELVAYPVSISLTAGGLSRLVTVTASGDFNNNNLSWDIKNNGGLTVENAGTPSRTRHQYKVSAPLTARRGTHTIVIEISDENANTAALNIPVTVSSASGTSSDQNNNSSNNNNDSSNGNDSSSGTTVTDEQRKQNFISNSSNVNKDSVKEINSNVLLLANFVSKLADIASGTEVASLNSDAFSSQSRTVNEVSESFNNEQPILALPILEKGTITEAKIYVFVADIADKIREAINATVIQYNSPVFIRVTKISVESGDVSEVVSLSEGNSTKGMFLDDEGNEITNALGLLNASNINVAAYLEPDTDYSFVVTASDVSDSSVIGPSGAGCITGSAIGLIAMILSSGIFKIRRKVKKSK